MMSLDEFHMNVWWLLVLKFYLFVFQFSHLFNLYGQILSNPKYYRQLKCGESLISIFNCPLENKYEDAWSHYNYIVYVIEGRKIWHTSHGSYDLRKGNWVPVLLSNFMMWIFVSSCFLFLMNLLSKYSKANQLHCPAMAKNSTRLFH